MTRCPKCNAKLEIEICPGDFTARCKNCGSIIGEFDGEDVVLFSSQLNKEAIYDNNQSTI